MRASIIGGGAALSDYLTVKNTIMEKFAEGDTDFDEVVTSGAFFGLYFSKVDATTSSWVTCTSSFTVPAGKKAVLVECSGTDGTILNSSNAQARLRETSGDQEILPNNYFGTGNVNIMGVREGSWGTEGKVIALQHYRTGATIEVAAWFIGKVVDA